MHKKPRTPSKESLAAHLKDGMSMTAIGERYRVSRQTICNKIEEFGLAALLPNKVPHKPTTIDRATLIAERRKGLSFYAIDNKHGLSSGTAQQEAMALGLVTGFTAVTYTDSKTIIGKRVTAGEYGGSLYLKISLPRVDMHIRAIQEGRGREGQNVTGSA